LGLVSTSIFSITGPVQGGEETVEVFIGTLHIRGPPSIGDAAVSATSNVNINIGRGSYVRFHATWFASDLSGVADYGYFYLLRDNEYTVDSAICAHHGTGELSYTIWCTPEDVISIQLKAVYKEQVGYPGERIVAEHEAPSTNSFLIPENNPPATPERPSGSDKVHPYTTSSYSTTTTDPDGDQYKTKWRWGDGIIGEWVDEVPSDSNSWDSHSWDERDTYYVDVKAKDVPPSYNEPIKTEYSLPLAVTVKWIFSYNISSVSQVVEIYPEEIVFHLGDPEPEILPAIYGYFVDTNSDTIYDLVILLSDEREVDVSYNPSTDQYEIDEEPDGIIDASFSSDEIQYYPYV
jgi:hypothetical protein